MSKCAHTCACLTSHALDTLFRCMCCKVSFGTLPELLHATSGNSEVNSSVQISICKCTLQPRVSTFQQCTDYGQRMFPSLTRKAGRSCYEVTFSSQQCFYSNIGQFLVMLIGLAVR